MIISHKHKFIFIKTQRTAGTSIQVALSKICGSEDIVTPLGPANGHAIEGHVARNFSGFHAHIGASEIKGKVQEETWNNYFKFAFERNPYDKVVSWYWRHKTNRGLTDDFNQFVEKCANKSYDYGFPADFDKYTLDGKVVVDFIGRYESLHDDLKRIYRSIGIPIEIELTRERSHTRKDRSHYSSFYNEDTKKLISKIFHREIALFGYEF